jgi:hypothetical protein
LGFEANNEGIFCGTVHIGVTDHPGAGKFICEQLVRVVVPLKKRAADFDQARIELKIGSTNLGGNFINVFGAELWFFGKAYHQVPFID